jgi:hypothetical protein
MIANCTFLLTGYTFGCHSVPAPHRRRCEQLLQATSAECATGSGSSSQVLNERHQPLAWASLFSVALTDVYIRTVATGAITT